MARWIASSVAPGRIIRIAASNPTAEAAAARRITAASSADLIARRLGRRSVRSSIATPIVRSATLRKVARSRETGAS
jgi:hypothetical protein